MAYKYKLSEMSKTASPEAAEKETGIPKDDQRVGKVTYSKDGDTKFTVTNINPETGQISWKITNLPAFDKLLDDADALISTSKGVYTKTKDDEKFREFYEEARSIRNKIRKHLRNEYPDEYKRIQMFGEAYSGFLRNPEDPDSKPFEPKGAVSEFREELRALFGKFKGDLKNPEFIKGVAQIMVNWKSLLRSQMDEADVDEASMSGAAGAYNTPYAFRLKGQKPNIKAYKELGYEEVKEALQLVHVYDKDGKMFGTGSVEKVEGDKTFVRFDGSTVKRFPSDRVKLVKEGKLGDGADLGPGPKAGPDGVTDSAYTKQFKYKLVPKTKDGTYVQKGSGMVVKKLF